MHVEVILENSPEIEAFISYSISKAALDHHVRAFYHYISNSIDCKALGIDYKERTS
jgi:hypothetical protein